MWCRIAPSALPLVYQYRRQFIDRPLLSVYRYDYLAITKKKIRFPFTQAVIIRRRGAMTRLAQSQSENHKVSPDEDVGRKSRFQYLFT